MVSMLCILRKNHYCMSTLHTQHGCIASVLLHAC